MLICLQQLELGTVVMFYKTNTGTNDLKLKILIKNDY